MAELHGDILGSEGIFICPGIFASYITVTSYGLKVHRDREGPFISDGYRQYVAGPQTATIDIRGVVKEFTTVGGCSLRDQLLDLLAPLLITEPEQIALGVLRGDALSWAALRDLALETAWSSSPEEI